MMGGSVGGLDGSKCVMNSLLLFKDSFEEDREVEFEGLEGCEREKETFMMWFAFCTLHC
ncbi:hypothetical protein HanPSC8_Chr03g0124441 [Helianthus annuus]|nr:hypothetical protein HanPSC8_Chr03g0124441 [Helianthus annuus]